MFSVGSSRITVCGQAPASTAETRAGSIRPDRRRRSASSAVAVHDRRIAGLAEAGDPSLADAEVALHDAEHRIDEHDIAEQHVERALCAGHAGDHPDAVAKGLAAAMQAFVAIDRVVVLHHGDQRGVAQPDAVSGGGSVQGGILGAGDAGHGLRLP